MNKKISLIFAILLLLFTGSLFSYEVDNPQVEILSLSDAFDFEATHESEGEFKTKAAKNPQVENTNSEIGKVWQEGILNILKYPVQRPEAKVSNHYLLSYHLLNSKKNNFTPI